MDISEIVQTISIWAIPVLFAITLHEVAHGWVARMLGDPTAFMMGRLTLNPLKHIDPIGTVLVPLVLLVLGGFVFGWARPVPVNFRNLHSPRKDMALVAVAGPAANLVMLLFWALFMKLGIVMYEISPWFAVPMTLMGQAGIMINLILMLLNLLPIPPLDGGRVLTGLVPARLSTYLDAIEPYGFFILLALLATGILGIILRPPMSFVYGLVGSLFGLPI
ncbi:MAG: site-2 protease family protein [Gammaproteobacteria bacterium]|nr:site-2 protease family protein [Gammaproteobacteria bacterium]